MKKIKKILKTSCNSSMQAAQKALQPFQHYSLYVMTVD